MADIPRRVALRAERERIRAEGDALVQRTKDLEGSGDLEALRAHSAALERHRDKVVAYEKALEAYHDEHGPLGGLSE